MSITYKQAGVDIARGNALVDLIKPIAAKTNRPEVVSGVGGFGALFNVPTDRYQDPVLVASTDGVGTKLKLAITHQRHEGIGFDLVAMCVNDVLCTGAEPLFFLDYFATGQLDLDVAASVIQSIGNACIEAGVALIGGETAEMPGLYANRDYDLAGFCVGVVERSKIMSSKRVQVGDAIIGLAATGFHSNGYSLVRKILENKALDLNQRCGSHSLLDALLAPTRIYCRTIKGLEGFDLHGIAHITGGGLLENIPRILPPNHHARIITTAWERPPVFDMILKATELEPEEYYRTFNAGIGMVLIVAAVDADAVLQHLHQQQEPAWRIGEIFQSPQATPQVELSTA